MTRITIHFTNIIARLLRVAAQEWLETVEGAAGLDRAVLGEGWLGWKLVLKVSLGGLLKEWVDSEKNTEMSWSHQQLGEWSRRRQHWEMQEVFVVSLSGFLCFQWENQEFC